MMLLNNNSAMCCVECFSHTLCWFVFPSFWALAIDLSHYAWHHPHQRNSRLHLCYSSNPGFHHLQTSLLSYSDVCYCSGALIASYTRLTFNDNVHRTCYTYTELLRRSLPRKSIGWRKAYYNSGHRHALVMDSKVCCLPRCMASMPCPGHRHLFEYSQHTHPDHFTSPHSALSCPAPAFCLNKQAAVFFSDHDFTVLLLVHPVITCVDANYGTGNSNLHASLSTSSEVWWCLLTSLLMHYTHSWVIHWVNAHSRFTSHVSFYQCIYTTEKLFIPALTILPATLHTWVVASHTHVLPTN